MNVRDRIKELRRVPASELRPNPKNWRTHPTEQKDALKGILAEVGFAAAALAYELPDGTLQLIDGHLRAETVPDQPIPVLILDVTEAEADKLLATFDPLGAMAGADAALLDELLRGVQTGNEAVAALLDETAREAGCEWAAGADEAEPGSGGDEFDATPEDAGPTRAQPGDLWVIGGKHKLLVGDCTDPANVARLMDGAKVGLCFTSPPYAQQREYGETAKEKVKDWNALMQGAFAPLADHLTPDGQILVNLGLVHRDGEWVPYWDGWIAWMREQGWRRFGWYVWDQGSGLPGDWNGRLAPSHEFIFHFNSDHRKPAKTVPKDPHSIRDRTGDTTMRGDLNAGRHWSSGMASLATHKIPDSVFRVQRQCGRVTKDSHHPAVYPVGLPSVSMECWPGDVYDPFLGSGTTLIAGHRLGRTVYGCELEPRYADVILKRAEAEGLTAEKAG
jgi:DNA modification methylase